MTRNLIRLKMSKYIDVCDIIIVSHSRKRYNIPTTISSGDHLCHNGN